MYKTPGVVITTCHLQYSTVCPCSDDALYYEKTEEKHSVQRTSLQSFFWHFHCRLWRTRLQWLHPKLALGRGVRLCPDFPIAQIRNRYLRRQQGPPL